MKTEILIIDDSQEIGEALQHIMESLGFTSKFFESAQDAIVYFRTELNPVIFLDIFLPNESGLDLLPRIKEINSLSQVIMMTGESDISNVVSSLKNKASDFLLKPFSTESVKISVERAIEYYTVLRENHEYHENIQRDMNFISSIQRKVICPQISNNCIFADYISPSKVSGSFQYTQEINGNTIIIFGDIEGNSITSSYIGLLAISILKDILRTESSPEKVLTQLNDNLYYKLNIHTLTAVCLFIDKSKNIIHFSNGGSTEPVLLKKESKEILYLKNEFSNIIGVMPGTEFSINSIPFQQDSIIFLYNPGFLPSKNNSKDNFENLVLNIQSNFKNIDSFENIKQVILEFVNKSTEVNPNSSLSFFLQII